MSNSTQNSAGDFLRDVFSTMVNKDDEVFKALFADPIEGDGTLETIFNQLESVRDKWRNNYDFYKQDGEMFEKTLSYFSFLLRLPGESNESIKNRNELLFYRQGDEIWGDIWNIKNIFKKYFRSELVYIVNNTNPMAENILKNGDFEKDDAWILDGCSYDNSARFSERLGIKFDGGGTCTQTVQIDQDSTYFLHFFMRGKINLEIKDNNGRYWDRYSGEFGEWTDHAVYADFSSALWESKSIFILTDKTISTLTIRFIGITNEIAMLDYARLFLKGNHSSFTLIVVLEGVYTSDTIVMAPGTDDPVLEVNDEEIPHDEFDSTISDYSKMSYFEQSHIFGTERGAQMAENVYTELLDMVGPGGIISSIEILTRESDDREVTNV